MKGHELVRSSHRFVAISVADPDDGGGGSDGGGRGVVVSAGIPVTCRSVYIRSLIKVTREYLQNATCERETKQSHYGKSDVW